MAWTRRGLVVTGGLGVAAIAAGVWISGKRPDWLRPGRELAAKEQLQAQIKPPILGDAEAPKRLVVWGSYTCAFTAQLFEILYRIVQDMPQTASVEWRHFPIHKPDPALHVAGMGFEGEHFWGFTFRVLREVLANGGDIQTLTSDKLSEFAIAEGGSDETLQAAYADSAKWAAVKQDRLAGHLLGITLTPGLFHNGYFLTPAGIPLDTKAFDASLRAMLHHG